MVNSITAESLELVREREREREGIFTQLSISLSKYQKERTNEKENKVEIPFIKNAKKLIIKNIKINTPKILKVKT